MLKVTKKFDYAMVLLTDLGLQPGTPRSARTISERYGLSHSLAANVLKGLQRKELVRSIRGVRGGYVLNRTPAEITLGIVAVAIQGQRRMTDCHGRAGKKEACPAFPRCPARGYMGLLEKKVRNIFEGSTLADVLSVAGARREDGAPCRRGDGIAGAR